LHPPPDLDAPLSECGMNTVPSEGLKVAIKNNSVENLITHESKVTLISYCGLARNLPRITESNTSMQHWVRTHFGGRSTTPQPTATAVSGFTMPTTTASSTTTIEMNGVPVHAHVASAEREGRYTKANSPVCDNRSRNKIPTPSSVPQRWDSQKSGTSPSDLPSAPLPPHKTWAQRVYVNMRNKSRQYHPTSFVFILSFLFVDTDYSFCRQ
uniref:Pecanex-like protein n=1 Tax=Hydatigena taeniaeformis TaxID=6205 RepID=A0A0R3WTE2_HYDTA